ncbi:PilZ domain-containing protein [Shewanella sp. 1CM18E]|uniref:PilZ domain-containing protein n=1 Tax=Shewanella sp. 1CM18E TaxID=2929169 RepID=UPI0020C0FB9F|nr:PilZ domain-containing protein [Shewanella sp. 1CM18E]MCK8045669.1 PilZ domain-containing protein [Shewanella sp. 1CM18E]
MDERRQFSRLNLTSDAKLISGENQWQTQLLDISLNGALIKQPQELTLACQSLTLEFMIHDSDICVQMQVRIVHQKNQQLGLACLHIDVESISHLRRLLELNLGDASLLDRELERLFGLN